MLALAWAAGTVPFSGLAAQRVAGVDLRLHGTGTVSGTGLYEVAGFAPLALYGSLDVAKGAAGPLLAGPGRPALAALALGASVVGHNWSPWLGGAGGRGVSPSLGGLLVAAPEGAATLLAGLVAGRLVRQTGIAVLVASAALVPVLGRRRGRAGVALGLAVTAPAIAKRLTGNRLTGNRQSPGPRRLGQFWSRLLFDRDGAPGVPAVAGAPLALNRY